ncbi:UTP11-like, U3 small nucleolar ribonucleoprotein [Aphanomyces cochlioides]|nr:UTP11-like, U3 small nucleolar ribonucleoprotein [Aphanomyces cochlioides]
MSSLRNAVKRREHKERAQPSDRKKLGILEKHKDYVRRAQDYHSKEKRLKSMQLKAAFRNPDEFYFSMNNAQTVDGKHVSTNNHREKLTAQVLKVMKTQDVAYLHMKRSVDLAKASKLSASTHFIDAEKRNTHQIFVDSVDEVRSFDPAQHFDTLPELVDRASNRLRKRDLAQLDLDETLTAAKESSKVYKELANRMERADKINRMRQHLDLERAVQAKGKKVKVADGTDGKPPVYKWKRMRTK